jgi:hypothetical protein
MFKFNIQIRKILIKLKVLKLESKYNKENEENSKQ